MVPCPTANHNPVNGKGTQSYPAPAGIRRRPPAIRSGDSNSPGSTGQRPKAAGRLDKILFILFKNTALFYINNFPSILVDIPVSLLFVRI
jgi:hypothetical protein